MEGFAKEKPHKPSAKLLLIAAIFLLFVNIGWQISLEDKIEKVEEKLDRLIINTDILNSKMSEIKNEISNIESQNEDIQNTNDEIKEHFNIDNYSSADPQ